MHETAIARNIIKDASKSGKVQQIYLEIGELCPVPPKELIECLHGMVDWKINSKIRKAWVKCTCGFEGNPKILERGHDYFFMKCPKCGEVPNLISGTEIKILRVVIE